MAIVIEPKEPRRKLNLEIPKHLWNKILTIQKATGHTISEIVRQILEKELQ